MGRFRRRKPEDPTSVQPAQPTAPGASAPPGQSPAGPTQPPSRPTTGSQTAVGGPEPTVNERLEGQRAWLAQLDRRVGVRSYAGAAALVIALAAAAVALVLVLQLRDDAAKTSDIDALRDEIAGVEDTATEAAEEDVQTMTQSLADLETEISELSADQDTTEQQLSVIEDDIQDLRDQIADLDQDSGSDSGGTATDTP